MKSKIYWINLGFLLIALISGYQFYNFAKKRDAFTKLFPIREMNTKLQFDKSIFSGQKLVIGSSIPLALKDNSNKNIAFPSKNIKIFTYDQSTGDWIEIPNIGTYLPDMQGITPISGEMNGFTTLTVDPGVYNKGKPVDIRVVVIANIYEGYTPTDEQVGAYIDLTVQP